MTKLISCSYCDGRDNFIEKEKGVLVCLYCGSILEEKADENIY